MSHWQKVACIENFFQLFQPWIRRAVVEVVYKGFGPEASRFSWRYGWAGLQIPFSLRIYFILFEPRQFNCNLLPRCCRPSWLSAFYRPWHWGLILNSLIPFYVEPSITTYGNSLANDRTLDRYLSLNFLILKTNGILSVSTVLHTLGYLATWSSVEMLLLFLQILTR